MIELEDMIEDADKMLALQDCCEGIPDFIRKDMEKAGMFKKENPNKDDYIEQDTLDVVLDQELFIGNHNKFVAALKKAINKNFRSEVFQVIREFGNEVSVVRQIIKSNNDEYLKKLVARKYMSTEIEDLILTLDNENAIKMLISRKDLSIKTQIQIVKMGKPEFIVKLLEKDDLNFAVRRAISDIGDEEFNKILSIKYGSEC